MEVLIPSSPPVDFDFGSARSSPINFLSAPSSPRRFGQCFLSAPASPTRISEFYRQYEDFSMAMEMTQNRGTSSVSSIPFDWEEKPGTPKKSPATSSGDQFDFDFAFDVKAESGSGSVSKSADELFSGGKIRPLKPPPRLQMPEFDDLNQKTPLIPSPRSPMSAIAQGRRVLRDMFSPRRKKQSDPFGESPPEEEKRQKQGMKKQASATLTSSSSSSSSTKGSSKRWSFKDFLLFRSASEGRGTEKDPLRRYVKKRDEGSFRSTTSEVRNGSFRSTSSEVKNGSFRSTSTESMGRGSRRRISAHEMHYAANKAASEDMKKKTFLPYKQGILAVHAIANGFGSFALKNDK